MKQGDVARGFQGADLSRGRRKYASFPTYTTSPRRGGGSW